MHLYEPFDRKCKVCRKCGTAAHRDGWYWFAGKRSRVEPTCDVLDIRGDQYRQWMKTTEPGAAGFV